MTESYFLLVTLHVVLFAYWLGGDWGVYVCSKYIARPDLPSAERARFLDALMLIDILPRSAIVLLPVVGMQLAIMRGSIELPDFGSWLLWSAGIAWLLVVWLAYLYRNAPLGQWVQRIDISWRVALILLLLAIGGWSLRHGSPFVESWLALKLIVYAILLMLGLYLRLAIRAWREGFVRLAREGPGEAVNRLFSAGRERARWAAYVFWGLIVLMAWLGVRQPVIGG